MRERIASRSSGASRATLLRERARSRSRSRSTVSSWRELALIDRDEVLAQLIEFGPMAGTAQTRTAEDLAELGDPRAGVVKAVAEQPEDARGPQDPRDLRKRPRAVKPMKGSTGHNRVDAGMGQAGRLRGGGPDDRLGQARLQDRPHLGQGLHRDDPVPLSHERGGQLSRPRPEIDDVERAIAKQPPNRSGRISRPTSVVFLGDQGERLRAVHQLRMTARPRGAGRSVGSGQPLGGGDHAGRHDEPDGGSNLLAVGGAEQALGR